MGDNLNGLISIKTDYSLLNSLVKVKDLLDYLKKNKYISCGIIDTNLSASMELISGCKELNIKPIVGLDIILDEKHLFLYAMNYDGYCNLLQVDLRKDSLNTDLLKEYSGETFRLFVLATHYRSPIDFSEVSLHQAEKNVARI